MKLTNDQINQYVIKFESELLKAKRIVFTRDKTWTRANFPDEAGIYVIYDKGQYVCMLLSTYSRIHYVISSYYGNTEPEKLDII